MASGPTHGSAAAILVTPARRIHILDGDATGGGHGPGRRVPGKSEFPGHLTDDEIIDGIEAIANDPRSYPAGIIPVVGPRKKIQGSIDGHPITVIVDPANGEVITDYPIGVVPNP